MEKQEIMQRISDHIEQDEDFADQLGRAIDKGTWEIVAELIATVVGFVITKTGKSFELLKELKF
jgi:hypothetical protein